MGHGTVERDERAAEEAHLLQRRGRVAGAILLVVHLAYTLFQIVSLLLSWHPPFISRPPAGP